MKSHLLLVVAYSGAAARDRSVRLETPEVRPWSGIATPPPYRHPQSIRRNGALMVQFQIRVVEQTHLASWFQLNPEPRVRCESPVQIPLNLCLGAQQLRRVPYCLRASSFSPDNKKTRL